MTSKSGHGRFPLRVPHQPRYPSQNETVSAWSHFLLSVRHRWPQMIVHLVYGFFMVGGQRKK